jgi:DegV family protein with EDD domain
MRSPSVDYEWGRYKLEDLIRIVTDSSCDVPRRLLERFNIAVVPLNVHFGMETYSDGDLPPDAFWERAAQVGAAPQTSQPSPVAFETVFETLVAGGASVLCLTLTGAHSGTFNSARLAAQRFGQAVRVFDSQSLSLGLGLQALEAARSAQVGRSMQEILKWLEDLRSRLHLIVVLDTLESLRRGGRADAFIAAADRMTRLLNLKAIVNFVEGRVQLLTVARSFQGGLRRVLDLVDQLGPLEHLAVVHARGVDKAEKMVDRLAERTGFSRERIWLQETGAVLASHAGAGAVGVVAIPQQRAVQGSSLHAVGRTPPGLD